MGCSSPQNAGIPNIPASYYQRILQVSQINNPLNVNKKYQHISKIDQKIQVGRSFKKTYGYHCVTTKQQLMSKRKQFWETRVNGNPEIWNAIRSVVIQPNQNQGRAILQRNKIYMIENSIQMCVDYKFNKYQVPVFCINQPISFAQTTWIDKNLKLTYQEQLLQLKIRSAKFPNQDINIKQSSSTEVHALKAQIRAMKQLPADTNIRLFYGGRQMQDDKALGNYNVSSGLIIQAMIR